MRSQNELEASIMLSKPPSSHPTILQSRRGAALTLLTRARNPSQLARAIYLHPELVQHPFISSSTAEDIGAKLGEELVEPSYFFTEHRWRKHRRGLGLPEEPIPTPVNDDYSNPSRSDALIDLTDSKHPSSRAAAPPYVASESVTHSPDIPLDSYPTGTVGAVALDIRGCIAAVTSTGGRTNKLPGRIGDTPLMGAGFWAEEWDENSSKGDLRKSSDWMLFPSWLRDIWDRLNGQSSPDKTCERIDGKVAVGVSGTGDGDVRRSISSAYEYQKS
jgi:beta-aspartyl-peptidase (threonine type)